MKTNNPSLDEIEKMLNNLWEEKSTLKSTKFIMNAGREGVVNYYRQMYNRLEMPSDEIDSKIASHKLLPGVYVIDVFGPRLTDYPHEGQPDGLTLDSFMGVHRVLRFKDERLTGYREITDREYELLTKSTQLTSEEIKELKSYCKP